MDDRFTRDLNDRGAVRLPVAMGDVAALLLELAAAGIALWAAFTQSRLRRLVDDPRVAGLALFFGLYALASLVHAVTAVGYASAVEDGSLARESLDGFDVAFWAHHALLVSALAAATLALGPPRMRTATPTAAVAGTLLVAEPILRLIETLALFHLTLVASLNHMRRQTVGSIRVAAGFLLLLTAQAGHLATTAPLGYRPWWAEALAATGMLVLWLSVPNRRS